MVCAAKRACPRGRPASFGRVNVFVHRYDEARTRGALGADESPAVVDRYATVFRSGAATMAGHKYCLHMSEAAKLG